MKLVCMAIALLMVAQPVRAQSVPAKSDRPPDRQRSASEDDSSPEVERIRALAQLQADQAGKRAAEAQQSKISPPDGYRPYGGVMGGARPVKGAWLGVSASSPPAALRRQLKLADGTGLVVDFVQPKSPAEQAGIKQYDLLVKLNDQLLINPEQLAVLVRTFKPGEDVHLRFFREGESQTQDVTLAERELPPLNEMQMQFFNDSNVRPVPGPMPPMHVSPFGGAQGTAGSGTYITSDGAAVQRSERSLTWLDGKRQITVNLGQDQKTMTMTDGRTGKVVYQGPVDANDDQKSLPKDARDAVERVRVILKKTPGPGGADSPKPEQGF